MKKSKPNTELFASRSKCRRVSALMNLRVLSALILIIALILLWQVIFNVLPIGMRDNTVHASELSDSNFLIQTVASVTTTVSDNNLKAAPRIPIPNDMHFPKQWAFNSIQALPLEHGNLATLVAVLDTGVDQQHEDLAGKVIDSINFTNSKTVSDISGHGTHVAGIIAANTNNWVGIAGVSANTHLLNVKTAEDNGITWPSTIARGIRWATDNNADIINIAAWVPAPSPDLDKAVDYAWSKGVVIIAAAGNNKKSAEVYPACYPKVLAVSAIDENNKLWTKSNFGNWTDAFAPGVNIYSTLPNDSYGYKSGTSMATAYVSAIAALTLNTVEDDNNNGLLNDEVMVLLKSLLSKPDATVNLNPNS